MTIEDLLAPLHAEPPTDDELQRLLRTADRRTRRRRLRIATGAVCATATVTALLAALPAEGPTPVTVPTTAAAILRTAAQTAADQPVPPAWAGYRYVQSIDRREDPGYTVERTEEEWVDSDWQGRMLSTAKLDLRHHHGARAAARRQGPAGRGRGVRTVDARRAGLQHARRHAQPLR